AAVISGNRNFEGRVHPLGKANYLASPPLVVAYALAGTVDIDLNNEPLGMGNDRPGYLRDILPPPQAISDMGALSVNSTKFCEKIGEVIGRFGCVEGPPRSGS